MNRRDALKAIGVLLGGAVSPAVARAASAGLPLPAPGEPLRALTPRQAEVVAALAERIIPATDTPGARAARVDAFVDALLADVLPAGERTRFLAELAGVEARARASGAPGYPELPPARQAALLSELEREARAAPAGGPRPFFPWIKELTLVGYYTSEVGASQELAYVHAAGYYDGDVPYARVGRAYS